MPRGRKRKEEITSSVGGDDAAEAEVKKSSEESPAKKRKELMKAFPDAVVLINDTKPRSKSFEVTVIKEDGEESLVWTGIKKGPPRKLKFPVNEEVIQEVKKLI
ncbi:Selenoprotein H [Acropora cervicornis]|uniref:Selenoprotein H n=1 Tax=Acropora cervicornis TaxID=6130 RepID=A0AAD9R7F1_ACRCE|nr:Selenoprotein H [Acropora cervicornis]